MDCSNANAYNELFHKRRQILKIGEEGDGGGGGEGNARKVESISYILIIF